jgi:dynein light chain Tctex-type 1
MSEEEFQQEDIEQIVKNSLQSCINQESKYDPETANAVSRQLLEACIKNLAAYNKPFKYVVTAIVMQKNGAGLHTAMGAYWDGRKDGALEFFSLGPAPDPDHPHFFKTLLLPRTPCMNFARPCFNTYRLCKDPLGE